MLIIAVSGAYLYLAPKLPDVNTLVDIQLKVPLRIYSADDKLIGEFGEQRRTPIAFKDVPTDFINAFISAEDGEFYNHHGISFKGLSRAIVQMLTDSDVQTGGSTITMQVAKNYFLTPERHIIRKVRELFLALQIERELSKEQIMELYINKIFLGHRSYGIVAAAQVYYGKSVDQLSLEQFATLAGIPKAPSDFNPITDPDRARIRRDWILSRMLKLAYIDQQQYQAAINTPISASRHQVAIDINAPYIAEMARREALSIYGDAAYTDGLKVYTSIDSRLQEVAQLAVKEGLHAYDNRHGFRRPQRIHDLDLDDPEAVAKAFTRVADIPPYSAAIVTLTEGQQLQALLRSGEQITVDWESIANRNPYINENRVGTSPEVVSDMINVSDVIYVQQNDAKQWLLGQIPNAEAALVSINPNNGAIIALVGGYDFYKSKFNRAIQAERQIGSTIKPFVYAAALSKGFTAASVINDAPLVIESSQMEDVWRPRNAGAFTGPTRFRSALYLSKNLVSVRILRQMGVGHAINYLGAFGFDRSKLPRDLSLALGSPSFTPMTVANAYAVLANGGYRIEPYLIDSIYNSNNELIYQASPLVVCPSCTHDTNTADTAETDLGEAGPNNNETDDSSATVRVAPRVISEDVAFIIDSILQDTVRRGTAGRARALQRPDIAGKTGTTNGPTDVWFSGYHPNVVTTTWIGLNDNSPLGQYEYGSSAALPIWIAFMQEALKDQPIMPREQPANVVSVLIDRNTGKRAQPGDANSMFEFIQSDALEALDKPSTSNDQAPISIEDIF